MVLGIFPAPLALSTKIRVLTELVPCFSPGIFSGMIPKSTLVEASFFPCFLFLLLFCFGFLFCFLFFGGVVFVFVLLVFCLNSKGIYLFSD